MKWRGYQVAGERCPAGLHLYRTLVSGVCLKTQAIENVAYNCHSAGRLPDTDAIGVQSIPTVEVVPPMTEDLDPANPFRPRRTTWASGSSSKKDREPPYPFG